MIKVIIYTIGQPHGIEVSMDQHDYIEFTLGLLTGVIATKTLPSRHETIYIKASKIEAIMITEEEQDNEG